MYKQVIVLREDLKISLGKKIVQACHASLGSYERANWFDKRNWRKSGEKKVVVKVKDLKKLLEIHEKVKKAKLPHFLVRDAGLTEVEPGTITALGIGPAKEEKIDKITGSLSLV